MLSNTITVGFRRLAFHVKMFKDKLTEVGKAAAQGGKKLFNSRVAAAVAASTAPEEKKLGKKERPEY